MLTDTVGFIDRLPTHLVKAFKSTLEEIKYADIIVCLVDSSDPIPNAPVSVKSPNSL